MRENSTGARFLTVGGRNVGKTQALLAAATMLAGAASADVGRIIATGDKQDTKWSELSGRVKFGEAAGEGLAARIMWVLTKYGPSGQRISHSSIRDNMRIPNEPADSEEDYQQALTQLVELGAIDCNQLGANVSESLRKFRVTCKTCGAEGPLSTNMQTAEAAATQKHWIKRLGGYFCPLHIQSDLTRRERRNQERAAKKQRREADAAADQQARNTRRANRQWK